MADLFDVIFLYDACNKQIYNTCEPSFQFCHEYMSKTEHKFPSNKMQYKIGIN